MWVHSLQVRGVRNLAPDRLVFDPRLNLFLGPNGAGKTSILEALYLLSRGRSFRGAGVRPVRAEGAAELRVYGEVHGATGPPTGIGVARGVEGLEMRIDGAPCASPAELSVRCPMRVVDPSAHELIQGPPAGRRRYLDWGVFHVEPGFLAAWRRYQAALRQRNGALRAGGGVETVRSFEPELVRQGEAITVARREYVADLKRRVPELLERLAWDAGELELGLEPGWRREESLKEALRVALPRDRQRGHTSVGPHRADLGLRVARQPAADRLSRGQQKCLALALLLAQAAGLGREKGETPMLLLDDVVAELDQTRRRGLFELLEALGGQAFVTAVEAPAEGLAWAASQRVFHVERGRVAAVV